MNDLPTNALARAVGVLKSEGFSVEGVLGDLSVSASARDVGLKTLELLGGLDYLINNAGAPGTRTPIPPSDLDALTDDFWDRILRINLLSTFWMTKTLASALTEAKGAVVNTVSVSALGGGGSSTAYATAKAGLASGIDPTACSRSRAGRARQRYCTGLREFELGVLVRRHGRRGKGDSALGTRWEDRRLCRGDCVSLCRRIVYHGRGRSGHGWSTYLMRRKRVARSVAN
jgi:hypothetical protein